MTIRTLGTPEGDILSSPVYSGDITAGATHSYPTLIERVVSPNDTVAYSLIQTSDKPTGNILDGPAIGADVVMLDAAAAIEFAKYVIKQEGVA